MHNVTILDTLPPELDFVSSAIGGVTQNGSEYDPNSHTVLWDIGTILAGQQGPEIDLEVRVNQNATPGQTIQNYATIDSDETPETTVTDDENSDDPNDEPGTDIIEIELCCDLDYDGDADIDDYWIFLGAYGTCVGDPGYIANADYDQDGIVALPDFYTWYNCYWAYMSPP